MEPVLFALSPPGMPLCAAVPSRGRRAGPPSPWRGGEGTVMGSGEEDMPRLHTRIPQAYLLPLVTVCSAQVTCQHLVTQDCDQDLNSLESTHGLYSSDAGQPKLPDELLQSPRL